MEFQALSEALGDSDEKQNRRFGRLMALWANMNRGKGQPSKSEDDFIPKRLNQSNKAGKAREAESKEEINQQITDFFSMFR